MPQRETALPGRDEMEKRLRRTRLTKATAKGLLSVFERHAGETMSGMAVVNRLMFAVAEYVTSVPTLTMKVVWDHAGEIVDVLIDDPVVKADAHAHLKSIRDNTTN